MDDGPTEKDYGISIRHVQQRRKMESFMHSHFYLEQEQLFRIISCGRIIEAFPFQNNRINSIETVPMTYLYIENPYFQFTFKVIN